jgi:predicted O-methyltransferase YrrM
MDFIDLTIQNYAEKHCSQEPEHLQTLNRYTHTSVMKPRMLSGHLQGRFLSMISKLMHPTNVLDIGTYTGYSALCLAEGVRDDGIVYTLDNNDEVMLVAERFIAASPYSNVVKTVIGDALENLRQLNTVVDFWDLIWIDAEKSEYGQYYELCIDKLRPGGLIMADNVLWSGKVTDSSQLNKDKDTQALHAFNEMIMNDDRVENVLLPVRDGILMIRKK